MAQNSKIEWTDATWNPVVGCSKISPGCQNCYAERMSYRLACMEYAELGKHLNGDPTAKDGFIKYGNVVNVRTKCWNGKIYCDYAALNIPLRWKTPRLIFVCSMSDLFHRDVPTDFILQTFDVFNKAPQHRFQVLTKRSDRLLQLNHKLCWPQNVWMGVTVERAEYTFRIDHLRQTDAAIKFLSLEPLLGPLDNLNLDGIDWVICGGENGPKARPMHPDWARSLRDQCQHANVPFFFKKMGSAWRDATPKDLEIREFPREAK